MESRKLEKNQWAPVLDAVSKEALAKRAEVEVAGLALGDQIEAEWVPLLGIVYDHKDDLIEIALEGLDHLIRAPQEVHIIGEMVALSSIVVIDGDQNRHILKVRDPLMLPAPADVSH
jgi:hypothetical protein